MESSTTRFSLLRGDETQLVAQQRSRGGRGSVAAAAVITTIGVSRRLSSTRGDPDPVGMGGSAAELSPFATSHLHRVSLQFVVLPESKGVRVGPVPPATVFVYVENRLIGRRRYTCGPVLVRPRNRDGRGQQHRVTEILRYGDDSYTVGTGRWAPELVEQYKTDVIRCIVPFLTLKVRLQWWQSSMSGPPPSGDV